MDEIIKHLTSINKKLKSTGSSGEMNFRFILLSNSKRNVYSGCLWSSYARNQYS